MEFITHSPEQTEAVGAALGKLLQPGAVIAYQGDLGAGKTAFTRGVACGLGAKESVTSPTVFFDDKGNELQLNRGKTFIAHFPAERLLTYTAK